MFGRKKKEKPVMIDRFAFYDYMIDYLAVKMGITRIEYLNIQEKFIIKD